MNEEEEKAIEDLKLFANQGDYITEEMYKNIQTTINLIDKQQKKINDLSNRIVQGIYHIEETCIAKNEDGTKREIASIGDLEELEDILGGKHLYE